MYWFTWNWAATQILLIASAAMLLRGRLRVAADKRLPYSARAATALVVLSTQKWSSAQITYSAIFLGDKSPAVQRRPVCRDTPGRGSPTSCTPPRAEQAEGAVSQERPAGSRVTCTTCWARACPRSRSRAIWRSGCCHSIPARAEIGDREPDRGCPERAARRPSRLPAMSTASR